MRKELRRGRVLIDWSQNHPAKTTVAVYSVRADVPPHGLHPGDPRRGGACARTGDPSLLRFDTEQVLPRVARDGDLFAPVGRMTESTTKAKAKRRPSPSPNPTAKPETKS